MHYEYLASPYTDENWEIRQARFMQACSATATLLERGRRVMSPIAHGHPIDQHSTSIPYDAWADLGLALLRGASKLVVLQLDGWESSRGVQEEIRWAAAWKIPVEYLKLEDLA